MAKLKIRGKQVFYTTGGKPWETGLPLLVFVHGAGGTQSVWISQSRALAHHGWNVAALDLPGHGYSEDRPELVSAEDYSEWLAEVLEGLGKKQAVLAGHSLGAAITLTCAATHAGRVAGLLLLGSRLEMEVSQGLLADTRDNPPQASRFIAAYGHAPATHLGGAPTPGSWIMGTARALVDGCDGAVLHRDFAASHSWRGAGYASRVSCPTLVVSGAKDRMTPAAKGREMAGAIKNAKFVEIPGTGHFMMTEAPRRALSIMRDFLEALPSILGTTDRTT